MDPLFDKAKVAFVQERFEEAAKLFGESLEKDPKNPLIYYSRGTARFNLKDYDGAIEDYTTAIGLYDKNERFFCSRGAAYLALDKSEKAMEDFNKAIDVNSFYPTAYFGRAEIFTRIGDKEQARLDIETATKIQKKRGQSILESQGIVFQDPNA